MKQSNESEKSAENIQISSKQDYCEWCGKETTELDIFRTCSDQCHRERAEQLVEKWKDVLDGTRLLSSEESKEQLKNAVLLESVETWLPPREERIAQIKQRHAEFRKAYLLKKWGMNTATYEEKHAKAMLIEPQERWHKV